MSTPSAFSRDGHGLRGWCIKRRSTIEDGSFQPPQECVRGRTFGTFERVARAADLRQVPDPADQRRDDKVDHQDGEQDRRPLAPSSGPRAGTPRRARS